MQLMGQENYQKIMSLGDKSIRPEENLTRLYPQKKLFSHIIGQIDDDNNGISGLEKSFDSFVKWTMDLREEFNIPHKLSDVIDKEKMDLDRLSKMAFEDPSTGGNPKKLTISDMKTMYQHSISGELF